MSVKKTAAQKVLNHIDRDEIIAKLMLGISPQDISANLATRYSNPNEKQFVLTDKTLTSFKDNSLDLYKILKEDLSKTQTALTTTDKELELAIKGSSAYKETMLQLAGKELDVKNMIVNMITALNTRIEQIFNEHQLDPSNINTRTERLFNEMIAQWKGVMELYHKYVLQSPDQIIQHNMTITHIDQYTIAIQGAVKETLMEIDYEASMRFLQLIGEKLEKLKMPTEQKIIPAEERFSEVKIINEEINKKLNDPQ